MGRKVFISFLGTGKYENCIYFKDKFRPETPVKYIQIGTLDYLLATAPKGDEWTSEDKAIFLLTDRACKTHWKDDGFIDRTTNQPIKGPGLYTLLKEKNYPMQILSTENDCLPNGNNEAEIWSIFSRIYDYIKDGDRLFFDVTHAFRYLPMLMLSLMNYAKFLKNVTIEHISYGNWEAHTKAGNGYDYAPIIDLLPLAQLQDWTFAAAAFIESSNADHICQLTDKVTKPLLSNPATRDEQVKDLNKFSNYFNSCVDDLLTCRGLEIIQNQKVKSLKDLIPRIKDNFITPLRPIVGKIEERFDCFSDTAYNLNGLKAADYCYQNKLYQQAATILQETVVSMFVERHGFNRLENREMITFAFNQTVIPMDESKWKYTEEEKEIVKKIIEDIKELNARISIEVVITEKKNKKTERLNLVSAFSKLVDMRNDYNHSGMRGNAVSANKIKNTIDCCIQFFNHEVFINTVSNEKRELPDVQPVFINLSNHSSATWGETQLFAAQRFGKVIDIPFPNIPASMTTEDVQDMANKMKDQIVSLTDWQPCTVHIMGEMTFTYNLVWLLKSYGYTCVASTSERMVEVLPDGSKNVKFEFCQFREY